jgi:hypothetical protein
MYCSKKLGLQILGLWIPYHEFLCLRAIIQIYERLLKFMSYYLDLRAIIEIYQRSLTKQAETLHPSFEFSIFTIQKSAVGFAL